MGVGISSTTLSFSGPAFRPSLVMTCPIKGTSFRCNCAFSLFSFILRSWHLFIKACTFASWFRVTSSSVSPSSWARMSSKIESTPWSPSTAWCWHLWKTSGAEDSPNGKRSHLYLPKGMLKVVDFELASSSCMCQNPFFTSKVLKTFALVSSGSNSPIVGNG